MKQQTLERVKERLALIDRIRAGGESMDPQFSEADVRDLIKEIERGQRMLLAACSDLGKIGHALDADMNADGHELLGIVHDLKSEAMLNRKDAERLDWLDGQYTHIVEGQSAADPEGEVVAYRWSVEEPASSVREAIDYARARPKP